MASQDLTDCPRQARWSLPLCCSRWPRMCPGISLRGSMKSSGGEQCDQVVGILPWATRNTPYSTQWRWAPAAAVLRVPTVTVRSLFSACFLCSCPTPGCDLRQAVCAPVQAFFLGFVRCMFHIHSHVWALGRAHTVAWTPASPSGETPSQEAQGAMKWPCEHAWAPLSSHTPPFCSFVVACLQFYLCSNSVLPRVINSRAHH